MTSVTTIRPEHTAQRDAAIAASRSLVATSGLSINVGCRSTPSHHTLTAAGRRVFSVIQTGSRALRCFRHRFACQRRRRATLVIPPCKIRGVAMATGLGFRILPCGHLEHNGVHHRHLSAARHFPAATVCCGDLASNSRDRIWPDARDESDLVRTAWTRLPERALRPLVGHLTAPLCCYLGALRQAWRAFRDPMRAVTFAYLSCTVFAANNSA